MKIFLDSGNPKETEEFFDLICGQTTNPSLVAKNPEVQNYLAQGKKLSQQEALNLYRQIVQEIYKKSKKLESISVEVIARRETSYQEMLKQAEQIRSWLPNLHLKFPCNLAGLKAANKVLAEGGRVNMTLVFSQLQALALAKVSQENNIQDSSQVLISPFIGRLDDQGILGVSLLKVINNLRKNLGAKFSILAASVRNLEHFSSCGEILPDDFATLPAQVLREYQKSDSLSEEERKIERKTERKTESSKLVSLEYQELEQFNQTSWESLQVEDPLLIKGLEIFTKDWESFTY